MTRNKKYLWVMLAGFGFGTPVVADETSLKESSIDESVIADSEPQIQTPMTNDAVQTRKNAETNISQPKLMPIPEGAEVSEGVRFAIDGKGFSIVVPRGWFVQKNPPRSSLFAQARVLEGDYPRNISVLRFSGPKLINQTTAEEFSEKLVKTFPTASSTIESYSLRNHQTIQMEDGREAILIYTDFTGSGRKMMQAHVLVSSETNHYLATFTDVAEHFESSGDSSQFLAEAWSAMTSIQLDSPNPVPGRGMEAAIGVLIGLIVFGFGYSALRRFLAARSYREFSGLDRDEAAAIQPDEHPKGVGETLTSVERPISGLTQKIDDANKDELFAEDGIRSGFGKRLLNLQSRFSKKTQPADEDLEFTSDEQDVEFKKGA